MIETAANLGILRVLCVRTACVRIVGCAVLLLTSGSSVWAQGYRLSPTRDPDQVVVDRLRHWAAWTMPSHLVDIDRSGTVRLRDFRTVYELLSDKTFGRPVVLSNDAPRIINMDSTLKRDLDGRVVTSGGKRLYDYVIRPGASRAGSNPHLARNIVDGSDTTYWEPNFDDPPEDWWVEVDLARPVPLQRLRLHFVPEGLGDPFYRYILLLGPSQRNFEADPLGPNFETFIPFEGVNTDQRTFVFDAERPSPALLPDARASSKTLSAEDAVKSSGGIGGTSEPSPEWDGKLVETIRIVITGSRTGRAEEISEEQWQALLPSERGDIVHFLKDGDFEEPVEEETYFELPENRQGRRVHYRRELPRLGEIEGWGSGDDIAPGILDGGVVTQTSVVAPAALFDGDYYTYNQFNAYIPSKPEQNVLTIDIGGTVWLDEVRIVNQVAPRGYLMRSSEGVRDAQGNLQWERLSSVEREDNSENGLFRLLTDVVEPARRVRFLDYFVFATGAHLDRTRLPRTRLMWLFSQGPPAEVVLESDLITLPGLFSLGAVRWEAEEPPGSQVEIRTRTGDQLLERILYCDNVGNCDYTAAQHRRLGFTREGPIDTSNVVGPGWSAWSRKYERSGTPATSPGLRRFMQFQVRLINHDRQAVPGVNQISVDLLKPVAQQLSAEVWPNLATAGRPDTFEVFLQPNFIVQPFDSSSPGFDEILLKASPSTDLRLLDLAIGTEDELASDQPFRLFDRGIVDGGGNSVLLDANDDTLRVLSQRDLPTSRLDSLWLRLPSSLVSVPSSVLPRAYYRLLDPGDEVPTGLDGLQLTVNSHNQLPEEDKGAVRYFRKIGSTLREVDRDAHQALPDDEQGPVRYYRVVSGLGEQTVFTALGDTLDGNAYNRLGDASGWVIGQGRLLRLRFVAAVFLPSTELEVAVRNAELDAPWQAAAGQDVTGLRPTSSLAIQTQARGGTVDDIAIAPNPFTPNMDQVNDEAHISFSLLTVAVPRPVVVQIYSLGGDPIRHLEDQLVGGAQVVVWDGRDDGGNLVPPGLYLCQIGVSADTDAGREKHTRVIAVVY